tara:strand:- start:2690 stop:4954 length:2265 start_codon:yes stop_codon:yes gene_type:complete
MSAETKITNLLNYITGSAGGWPSNTNVSILMGVDYFIETGSNNIYFSEMNTACGVGGELSRQEDTFDKVSDYANQQGCTTAYVYGQNDDVKHNPSSFQEPLISSSFARHNISVNFEYNGNTSHTYFSQRGQNQFTGSFHLWMQTPWFSDDTLLNIASGSFNKGSFRNIVSSSPESDSLIPLFDKDNYTPNTNFPDYVTKQPTAHSSLGTHSIGFKKYQSGTTTYQDAVDSGYITEKFIVSSGGYSGGRGHLLTNKKYYWVTPTEIINAGQDIDQSVTYSSQFIMSGSEAYHPQPRFLRIVASGSLVNMYDNSTKQIQDVEVGDVVKSYQPIGMPDESEGINWESYTTTDLSGSFSSGSIVIETTNKQSYGYYLINGSIKVPAVPHTMHGGGKFFCKTGDTWSWKQSNDISVGDYFLNSDGSELEITSKTDVLSDETFYGLNVEDIDTYFQSNILVHNIPPFCFVEGTPITMGDGTTKAIELIEVGDEIKNYDFDTKEIKVGKVLSIDTPTHADIIEISFGDKKTKNTFDHPYWIVGKGWSSYKPQWTEKRYNIKSEQLEVGDKCLELQGNKIVETNITDIQEDINPVQTYSLGVETHKNYFANDMLVHNKGSFCFTYETMITLADGTYQPICKIRPNDMIKTYDVETGKLQNSKVLETVKVLHDNMVTYKFNDNTKIEATDDHPFYIVGDSEVDSDYRPLTIGDVVLNDELQKIEVVNIEVNNVEKITYNINRTDNGKNYFANRVLVSDEFDTE